MSRLLIVDDDPSILEALSELFGQDFDVETYASAPPALEALATRTFCAAIVDMVLPGLSGLDLLKALKRTWPHTEIIIMTGMQDQALAEECFAAGAYDFVTKPWDQRSFQRIVSRAAERFELGRRLVAADEQLKQARRSDTPAGPGQDPEAVFMQLVSRGLHKLPVLVAALERAALLYGLAQTQWNQVRTARLLGLHRNTVVKMMKRYKITTVPRPMGLKKKKPPAA